MNWSITVLLLAAGLHCAAAGASGIACGASSPECAPVGEWRFSLGLGAGVHTNPLVGGDDIPVVFLPGWSYYGERIFVENLTVGYSLFESADQSLSLALTPGLDHVYFEQWGIVNFGLDSTAGDAGPSFVSQDPDREDGRAGEVDANSIDDRRIAILGGVGYSLHRSHWSLHVQALHDASSIHRGEEFRFALARSFSAGLHTIQISGGFVWQSADLLDYYYGLDENEVATAEYAYRAGSGTTPFIKLNWKRKLGERWTWDTVFNYRRLDEEITASPIVREDEVFIFFSAATYHF